MKLIQPFEALIKNGVSVTFKMTAAGDGDQIQLDILPAGKDSKTGVALPPRALLGTAAELDANLEDFLQKYAGAVTRIADVVANADQELQQVEAEAATAARKALEQKRAAKAPNKGASAGKPAAPKRNMSAGLIDNDGDAGGNDGDDDESDEADTTLKTSGAAATETPVAEVATEGEGAGGDGNALSPSLF